MLWLLLSKIFMLYVSDMLLSYACVDVMEYSVMLWWKMKSSFKVASVMLMGVIGIRRGWGGLGKRIGSVIRCELVADFAIGNSFVLLPANRLLRAVLWVGGVCILIILSSITIKNSVYIGVVVLN